MYSKQYFSADAAIKSGHEKLIKNNLKSRYEILFFLKYCPELPKRPKQKNSCSKMWLIDQLYVKLGCSIRMCTMYIPIFCSYKFKHNKAVLGAIAIV